MRRLGQVLAVLVVLVVSAGLIHAAGTPQKCAGSKIKAASKKISARLKCISKAVSKGEAVDSACLSKADTKFTTSMTKAEAKGGCALTGDAATLETVVDNDANAIAALTTPAPLGCCEFPNVLGSGLPLCNYEPDPNCLADGATPGASGSVCDGATGTCKAPPAAPGLTCSGNFDVFSAPFHCMAGPFWSASNPPRSQEPVLCSSIVVGFLASDPNAPIKYDPNAVCPPDGGPAVE